MLWQSSHSYSSQLELSFIRYLSRSSNLLNIISSLKLLPGFKPVRKILVYMLPQQSFYAVVTRWFSCLAHCSWPLSVGKCVKKCGDLGALCSKFFWPRICQKNCRRATEISPVCTYLFLFHLDRASWLISCLAVSSSTKVRCFRSVLVFNHGDRAVVW